MPLFFVLLLLALSRVCHCCFTVVVAASVLVLAMSVSHIEQWLFDTLPLIIFRAERLSTMVQDTVVAFVTYLAWAAHAHADCMSGAQAIDTPTIAM